VACADFALRNAALAPGESSDYKLTIGCPTCNRLPA